MVGTQDLWKKLKMQDEVFSLFSLFSPPKWFGQARERNEGILVKIGVLGKVRSL